MSPSSIAAAKSAIVDDLDNLIEAILHRDEIPVAEEVSLIKDFVRHKASTALTERLALVYTDLLAELEDQKHLTLSSLHGCGAS